MKPTVTLTPENAAPITKIAKLIGWTPERLANHLLAEMLDLVEPDNGLLASFLGSIDFDSREIAERVLALIIDLTRYQHGGQLPESFKAEIRELADGRFDVRAEMLDPTGEIYQIC